MYLLVAIWRNLTAAINSLFPFRRESSLRPNVSAGVSSNEGKTGKSDVVTIPRSQWLRMRHHAQSLLDCMDECGISEGLELRVDNMVVDHSQDPEHCSADGVPLSESVLPETFGNAGDDNPLNGALRIPEGAPRHWRDDVERMFANTSGDSNSTFAKPRSAFLKDSESLNDSQKSLFDENIGPRAEADLERPVNEVFPLLRKELEASLDISQQAQSEGLHSLECDSDEGNSVSNSESRDSVPQQKSSRLLPSGSRIVSTPTMQGSVDETGSAIGPNRSSSQGRSILVPEDAVCERPQSEGLRSLESDSDEGNSMSKSESLASVPQKKSIRLLPSGSRLVSTPTKQDSVDETGSATGSNESSVQGRSILVPADALCERPQSEGLRSLESDSDEGNSMPKSESLAYVPQKKSIRLLPSGSRTVSTPTKQDSVAESGSATGVNRSSSQDFIAVPAETIFERPQSEGLSSLENDWDERNSVSNSESLASVPQKKSVRLLATRTRRVSTPTEQDAVDETESLTGPNRSSAQDLIVVPVETVFERPKSEGLSSLESDWDEGNSVSNSKSLASVLQKKSVRLFPTGTQIVSSPTEQHLVAGIESATGPNQSSAQEPSILFPVDTVFERPQSEGLRILESDSDEGKSDFNSESLTSVPRKKSVRMFPTESRIVSTPTEQDSVYEANIDRQAIDYWPPLPIVPEESPQRKQQLKMRYETRLRRLDLEQRGET